MRHLVLYMVTVLVLGGCVSAPVERTSSTGIKARSVQTTRECDPPADWDKATAWAKGSSGADTVYERRDVQVEYSTRGSSHSRYNCTFRIEAGSSSEVRRERGWR